MPYWWNRFPRILGHFAVVAYSEIQETCRLIRVNSGLIQRHSEVWSRGFFLNATYLVMRKAWKIARITHFKIRSIRSSNTRLSCISIMYVDPQRHSTIQAALCRRQKVSFCVPLTTLFSAGWLRFCLYFVWGRYFVTITYVSLSLRILFSTV